MEKQNLLNFEGTLWAQHRDPARIQPFLQAIGELWEQQPDMRFGQLMQSFFTLEGDPFSWEEDEFLQRFTKWRNRQKKGDSQ